MISTTWPRNSIRRGWPPQPRVQIASAVAAAPNPMRGRVNEFTGRARFPVERKDRGSGRARIRVGDGPRTGLADRAVRAGREPVCETVEMDQWSPQ